MKISFIIPSRNNLKYFKWAFESIQKNKGNHDVYICAADDASTDGTSKYFKQLAEIVPEFSYITNEGPERVGHTILYDRIINELVKTEIAIIYHADMYLAPGALDAIEANFKCTCTCHLDDTERHIINCCDSKFRVHKRIVSLTRIEPPLHPEGPEKIIRDFGIETEEFDEEGFLKSLSELKSDKNTVGVFAPWAFWVNDFKEIGGHDPLFAPQSKEDSDIFNRFHLNRVEFIQTWEGFVYHMTCRGSRYNPNLTTPGKESQEWLDHNIKSTRNFVRKWGSYVKHDQYMKPIIHSKYNIVYNIESGGYNLLELLEPWSYKIYIKDPYDLIISDYINKEQKNTKYDLSKRVINSYHYNVIDEDIIVSIDSKTFDSNDYVIVQNLSEILDNHKTDILSSNNLGKTFTMGNLSIKINSLNSYEKDLIKL